MLAALLKACAQLPDPRFRRVLWRGVLGAAALFAVTTVAVGWGLHGLRLFDLGWANTIIELLGSLAAVVVSLMLFPSIAALVISLLAEDIAQAVEQRHYPNLPPPRRQGMAEILRGSLRLAAVSLGLNVLALPAALLLWWVLGVGAFAYYLLNGYLLAREYFELVAWRRMEPDQADALRRAHGKGLWALGVVLAVLSTLPLVNLLAPLLSTAAMVHVVERLRSRALAL